MIYIDLIDGEFSLSREEIRAKRPSVSMPEGTWSEEVFAIASIAPMIHTDIPVYDVETHKCIEVAPERVDGQWYQRWEIVPIESDA